MESAFLRMNIIAERINVALITIVILQCNFGQNLILQTIDIDDLIA